MSAIMGVLLAVAYKAPPGPVTIETFRRGCAGGLAPALAFQGGALMGNLILAGVALFGAHLVVADSRLALLTQIVGAALLVHLGLSALHGAPTADEGRRGDESTSSLRGVLLGTTISLANPVALLFWFALAHRAVGTGGDQGSFLAGFTVGLTLTSLAIAIAAALAHQRLSPRLIRLVGQGCGLAMILFGLRMGAELLY